MMLAAGPLLTRTAFLTASYYACLLSSLPSSLTSNNIISEETIQLDLINQQQLASYLLSDDKENTAESVTDSDANDYAVLSSGVRARISSVLDADPSLTGPLIRLAFHDATTWEQDNASSARRLTTGGPNGSIQYEVDRPENRALSKPLAVIQRVRAQESGSGDGNLSTDRIKGNLSLADTIALAGAAAVQHAGGPTIPIRMGRPDVIQADPYILRQPLELSSERSKVTSTMPSAGLDSDGLRLYFGKRLHLQEEEWVALSGVHGLGRHVTLLGMDKACLKNLTQTCLEDAPQSLPFVAPGVDGFSNNYFRYLLLWNKQQIQLGDAAFIPTDVALVVDPGLRKHVERFAKDERRYARVFARAYQKLVETTAITKVSY